MSVSVQRTGDWNRMERVMRGLSLKAGGYIDNALKTEAERAATAVRENIDSGGALGGETWPALSPITLAMSPNARPLLGKNGEMRDAVQAHRVRAGQYMVGIRTGTRSKAGVDLALIGAVHENGAAITIAWTPQRLRMFWALVGKTLGRGRGDKPYRRPQKGTTGSNTSVAKIPARPFLRPMLAKMRAPTYGLKGRVQQYFMRSLAAMR